VNEQLAIKEGLFTNSPVTPAARANDTTDVWAVRHGCYTREASQPFRSASIDHIQCGEVECARDGSGEFPGANLGLYSITFVNDVQQDREALLWYKEFREEAERKQFRHFLEVFDPNVDAGIPPEKLGEFINDNILRTLAGVPETGRHARERAEDVVVDRKSTRLNSSHDQISYAVFCLKKKKKNKNTPIICNA